MCDVMVFVHVSDWYGWFGTATVVLLSIIIRCQSISITDRIPHSLLSVVWVRHACSLAGICVSRINISQFLKLLFLNAPKTRGNPRAQYRVFIKYCVFPYNFVIFLNSASSAAALVFYLPGVCTHTDTEANQRKAGVRNILKPSQKTQYLMNTLYIQAQGFP